MILFLSIFYAENDTPLHLEDETLQVKDLKIVGSTKILWLTKVKFQVLPLRKSFNFSPTLKNSRKLKDLLTFLKIHKYQRENVM